MSLRRNAQLLFIVLIFSFLGCAGTTKSTTPENLDKQKEVLSPQESAAFGLYDLESEKWLALENGDLPVIPASSIKVLTTYAALKKLGADFKFHTDLEYTGKIRDGILHGDLILHGGGDPTLFSSDLMHLADQLSRAGIKKVAGQTYFEASHISPMQQLSAEVEMIEPYNAPITGLNLDFNQSNENGDTRKPMENPPQVAANRFVHFARTLGVHLKDAIPFEAETDFNKNLQKHLLYRHQSVPLNQLVRATLEYSNNLLAEAMCLAAAQKHSLTKLDLERGARIAKQILTENFPEIFQAEEWSLENCSGLGLGTKISAKLYVKALIAILADRDLPVNILSLLKFSGADFNSAVKSGGMDYHVSLGGVILSEIRKPKVFFGHFGNMSLREESRRNPDRLRRKADAQEWARSRRLMIQAKINPFQN